MPTPKCVKHVQSFVQTCSWFRKFIAGFSEISRPLTDLLKKKSSWEFGEKEEEAFEILKNKLVSTPVLRQADPTKPYMLRTDASNFALGAVLLQGEEHEEKPVEYASRLLTSAEKNYSTVEREALAVIWAATKKFRCYLEGAEVTIATDHQPLQWLFHIKTPVGRLARWAMKIQGITPYLKILSESLAEAKERIELNQDKSKFYADKSRGACTYFKSKDLVWLKTHPISSTSKGVAAKLMPRRDGPYEIDKAVSPTTYILSDPYTNRKVGKYHVSDLTPFFGRTEEIPEPTVPKRPRGRPRKLLSSSRGRQAEARGGEV